MSTRYSSQQLLAFLKQSAMEGRINPATARSRRNAAEQLLGQITDAESADLRALDVDDLCSRFHKLQGSSIRPESLEIYGQRLKAALQDFVSFTENPEAFVAAGPENRQLRRRKDRTAGVNEEEKALEAIKLTSLQQPPDLLPIPIREDLVVYVQNLPLDLTEEEAGKIARIVEAHASASSQ
ncbi:MAG: hypothetical protein AAGA23_21570 [Pseudomonadota bacterium]